MSSLSVGTGYIPGIDSGAKKDPAKAKAQLENTVKRLEKEQNNYKKEKESGIGISARDSQLLDKKINSLEDKITNLQSRLNKMKQQQDDGECETCKNRKYQDGSNDPGVSFKAPSKIAPESAEAAVRGHEYEHVNRNQAAAERENKEIVYQSVRIKHGICPECHKDYVAGGETVTVTRTKPEQHRYDVGLEKEEDQNGRIMDLVA